MIPNSYLNQYSNEDINRLIVSGSVSSKFDSSGNLLIDCYTSSMADTSLTFAVGVTVFNPTKVEEKYDVSIKEFQAQ
jgi:hypothetical protein